MQIIAKVKFGSHLYGTNTPESDTDYKGIFIPSKEEFILDTWHRKSVQLGTKKTKAEGEKNTKDDVDFEVYSLHYFLKLALEGQTVAIDILHAPPQNIIITSPIFEKLQENRHLFYTKTLESFVSYANQQASKYGLRGSRLSLMFELRSICERINPESRLKDIWGLLPISAHSNFIEDSPNGIKQYVACGKILQETVSAKNALVTVNKYINEYGARARQAEQNDGIDWKAISHALRVAFQTKHIFLERNIIFPLREAKFLLKVKQGKFNYAKHIGQKLEELMDEVKYLSKQSPLPDKTDAKFCEDLLIEAFTKYVLA